MQTIVLFISFMASAIGAICGIGGGIIIKPVLDAITDYSATTVSFMSGIVVLCMTSYSIGKVTITHNSRVKIKTATLLGIGAAIGGITGKRIFEAIKLLAGDGNTLTAIQSIVLLCVTCGTILYCLNKNKIETHSITNWLVMVLIGILLGMISAFLGIGGGPLNLIVLYFLFSMETKEAAQNSLYIILISQLAATIFTIILGTIPTELPIILLLFMGLSGIAGGIVGRIINRKINSSIVHKLFIVVQIVIACVCIYNFVEAVYK